MLLNAYFEPLDESLACILLPASLLRTVACVS